MSHINLKFEGYWREGNQEFIPEYPGIYCVYSCTRIVRNGRTYLRIRELLYIGESENVNKRIKEHEHYNDWRKRLQEGEILCFSFAPISRDYDRKAAETALINHCNPTVNKKNKDNYTFDPIELDISGKHLYLDDHIDIKEI